MRVWRNFEDFGDERGEGGRRGGGRRSEPGAIRPANHDSRPRAWVRSGVWPLSPSQGGRSDYT